MSYYDGVQKPWFSWRKVGAIAVLVFLIWLFYK